MIVQGECCSAPWIVLNFWSLTWEDHRICIEHHSLTLAFWSDERMKRNLIANAEKCANTCNVKNLGIMDKMSISGKCHICM